MESDSPAICPNCHQPILPQYYFCPNCGANLRSPPLSTTAMMQLGIYAFSIILPMICFLAISKWPGMKYYRSNDPKAKMIGTIAWVLIVLSTITTIYLAYVWTEEAVQSSIQSVNTDLNFY